MDICFFLWNIEHTTRDVQAILLTRGVRLSTDALALALANDIPVLLLDDTGHPAGHFWSGQYGSISTIRKRQARWADDVQARLWVRQLLHRKIGEQRAFLQALGREQPAKGPLPDALLAYLEAPVEDRKKQFQRRTAVFAPDVAVGQYPHLHSPAAGLSSD